MATIPITTAPPQGALPIGGATGLFKKLRSDFVKLSDALKSGDLTSARNAFSTLKKDLPHDPNAATEGNKSREGNNQPSPFSALEKALEAGDLIAAQQAFAAMRKDEPPRPAGSASNRNTSTAQSKAAQNKAAAYRTPPTRDPEEITSVYNAYGNTAGHPASASLLNVTA